MSTFYEDPSGETLRVESDESELFEDAGDGDGGAQRLTGEDDGVVAECYEEVIQTSKLKYGRLVPSLRLWTTGSCLWLGEREDENQVILSSSVGECHSEHIFGKDSALELPRHQRVIAPEEEDRILPVGRLGGRELPVD